jgi:hypothetical protein
MPYIEGKRATIEEWRALHPLKRFSVNEDGEQEDEGPPPAEEETPPKRTKTKAQATKAAIFAATGVVATSLDEEAPDAEPA